MAIGRPRTRPRDETRLEAARRQGTYEHLRDRITALLVQDMLTHAEVAERIGVTHRQERWICQVLEIKASQRRNRWEWRRAVDRRVEHYTRMAMGVTDERALVREIRSYTTGWDRGW